MVRSVCLQPVNETVTFAYMWYIVILSDHDVMISYNWGDSKPEMLKLKKKLQEDGYRVWMDEENLVGKFFY